MIGASELGMDRKPLVVADSRYLEIQDCEVIVLDY
jgi:hypothetical protein